MFRRGLSFFLFALVASEIRARTVTSSEERSVESRESVESDERFPLRETTFRARDEDFFPVDRDDYRTFVVDADEATIARDDEELPPLVKLDCDRSTVEKEQEPGFITAIRSTLEDFSSVEQIKCQVEREDDSGEVEQDDDDLFYKLSKKKTRVIVLDPTDEEHKSSVCPRHYLLTGIHRELPVSADSEKPSTPLSGVCLKLIRGRVDDDACESVSTDNGGGGQVDPYEGWNVECGFGAAAVGLKFDGKRVKSLRCCKLTLK